MDYEERIKQEIETMKAKRAFALQATANDALHGLIDELCTFVIKKQMRMAEEHVIALLQTIFIIS